MGLFGLLGFGDKKGAKRPIQKKQAKHAPMGLFNCAIGFHSPIVQGFCQRCGRPAK